MAKCWGDNPNGKLGTGSDDFETTPTTLAEQSQDFSRVLPGLHHTCALRKADGSVRCFGENDVHQFGNGSTVDSLVPVTAADNKVRWNSITIGDNFACGLRNAGKIFCWGDNSHGQLGVGNIDSYAGPTQLGTSPEPIAREPTDRS